MVDEKYERIEKEAININQLYERMAEEYWLIKSLFAYKFYRFLHYFIWLISYNLCNLVSVIDLILIWVYNKNRGKDKRWTFWIRSSRNALREPISFFPHVRNTNDPENKNKE